MATGLVVWQQVADLIQELYSGTLAIALNQTSPLYTRLQARNAIVTDTRMAISWPVISGPYTGVNTIQDGGRLPDPGREEYTHASLAYKIIVGTVRVGRMLQIGSKGPEYFRTNEGATVLEQQVNAAIREIARQIHFQLAADTQADVTDLLCLGDVIGKDDNLYAGINRVGNAFWQSYVNDNAGVDRVLTEVLLRDIYDTMTNDRGVMPEEVWCGLTAWNALSDLLGQNVRQNDPRRMVGGPVALEWKGLEFYQIPGLDPNSMFFLNFSRDGGIQLKKQHEEDFITRPEATDSYDERMSIAGHYELVINNPYAQAALKDVR